MSNENVHPIFKPIMDMLNKPIEIKYKWVVFGDYSYGKYNKHLEDFQYHYSGIREIFDSEEEALAFIKNPYSNQATPTDLIKPHKK